MAEPYPFIPFEPETYPEEEMIQKSQKFYEWAKKRRSIREFSDKPVSREIIENIILTAGSAPNGANKQPWTFAVVSDPEVKHKIRVAAEIEEKELYLHKISDEWRQDLAPLGTDWHKPFIDIAPYLIIVFKQNYYLDEKTKQQGKHYYVNESVGIAVGMLIMAIHNAGLVTLTHTPSPMGFLGEILQRPKNEKAFVLLPVGYPAENVKVPLKATKKKSLSEISIWK